MRRLVAAALVCLALAACTAIPDSGGVQEGDSAVSQPKAPLPILEGPEVGATPRSIVQGFLQAAAGGSVSGFDTARLFLSPEASSAWDPLAQVTVFDSRQVFPSFDDATGTFTYSVPVAARVNADGVLVEASPDEQTTLTFSVTTDEDGRSRISALDDGIVMSAADFASNYRPVKLLFVSKDDTTLVPELRWFPSNDQVATAVARELIDGPSPWLADAVDTGFPPGSALKVDAVVVDEEGLATVTLASGSAGNAADRSLAGEQLRLTLTQVPSVQDVVTTVGTLPLAGDESASPTPAPLPNERAAVIDGGRLGMWDGDEVKVTPAEVGVVPAGATGLALAYDLGAVAMVVDGSVVTSTALADAPTLEAPPEVPDAPGAVIATTTVIEGNNLVAPSYDQHGWLWTTEGLSEGVILAAGPDGVVSGLPAPQLAGRTVQALAVSRDGSRVVVLSRASGNQVVEVMAIVRGAEGQPLGLAAPLALGLEVRLSLDVAWLDDVSVAVLGAESGDISMIEVGGWTTDVTPAKGATSITGRNGVRTLLAVGEGGTLLARSGNKWNSTGAQNVSDVTFAG